MCIEMCNVSAGSLKCERHQTLKDKIGMDQNIQRFQILYLYKKLLFKVFVLKLIADDIPLLADVFPGVECSPVDLDKLINEIKNVCQ